jgi:WD40 repeat protein
MHEIDCWWITWIYSGKSKFLLTSKIMAVEKSDDDSRTVSDMKYYWLAHVSGITSISYVHTKDIIMSSSSDCTIRLWTLQGIP